MDIRNENDILRDGVVDLRLTARGKAIWAPRYQIPRKKYKTFYQGQQIEAFATAEIVLGSIKVNP